MITAAGIILLSLSIIGFGFSYGKELKNEKLCVDGLTALAERINTRIRCFRQGIDEIFDGFTDPYLDSIGFTADLRQNGLLYALKNNEERLSVSRDIIAEAKKFAQNLGKSYYEEQLTLCSEFLSFLNDKKEKIKEGLPTKVKLSITLSCALSALSAILFL